MILSWMAYASICATVCAVAGGCVDALVRHRLQRRRFVWVTTMSASLLLPVVVPVTMSLVAPVASAPLRAGDDTRVTTVGNARALTPAANWNRLTAIMWVSSSLLLAAALLWSQHRMRRRMHAFREANVDGERLLVSDDFGPALVGWLHPRIVLPMWALSLADAERRLVVSHELEHRRASDPVLTIGALIAVVLLPWNVALWWQLKRLQLAIEFDCDARVIRRLGADPFAYGNMLVAAQRYASHARGPVLAMAPLRTALGKRVQALVARSTPTRLRSLGALTLAAGAFSAFAVTPIPLFPLTSVASIANAQRRADIASPVVGEARMRADAPVFANKSEPAVATRPKRAERVKVDAIDAANRSNGLYGGHVTSARLVGGAGGSMNTPRDAMAAFRARYPGDTIVRSGFMGAEVRPRAALTRPPNSR